MKRFITLLVLLATYAISSTAQELPFFLMCLADEDKPREIAYCREIYDALDAHEDIRWKTPEDTAAVLVTVVPYDKDGVLDDVLPVSVIVGFYSSAFNGLLFYIAGGMWVVEDGKHDETAATMAYFSFSQATKWLAILPDRMPQLAPDPITDRIRLETSPP
jgi:hypothetical protein